MGCHASPHLMPSVDPLASGGVTQAGGACSVYFGQAHPWGRGGVEGGRVTPSDGGTQDLVQSWLPTLGSTVCRGSPWWRLLIWEVWSVGTEPSQRLVY